jgi:hypothetical protein
MERGSDDVPFCSVWLSRRGLPMAIAMDAEHACQFWQALADIDDVNVIYHARHARRIAPYEFVASMNGWPARHGDPSEEIVARAAAAGYLFEYK